MPDFYGDDNSSDNPLWWDSARRQGLRISQEADRIRSRKRGFPVNDDNRLRPAEEDEAADRLKAPLVHRNLQNVDKAPVDQLTEFERGDRAASDKAYWDDQNDKDVGGGSSAASANGSPNRLMQVTDRTEVDTAPQDAPRATARPLDLGSAQQSAFDRIAGYRDHPETIPAAAPRSSRYQTQPDQTRTVGYNAPGTVLRAPDQQGVLSRAWDAGSALLPFTKQGRTGSNPVPWLSTVEQMGEAPVRSAFTAVAGLVQPTAELGNPEGTAAARAQGIYPAHISGGDALLAAAQTAANMLAPGVEAGISSAIAKRQFAQTALQARLISKGTSIAAHAIPGAVIGALYDPSDPLAGGVVGGVVGGVTGALRGGPGIHYGDDVLRDDVRPYQQPLLRAGPDYYGPDNATSPTAPVPLTRRISARATLSPSLEALPDAGATAPPPTPGTALAVIPRPETPAAAARVQLAQVHNALDAATAQGGEAPPEILHQKEALEQQLEQLPDAATPARHFPGTLPTALPSGEAPTTAPIAPVPVSRVSPSRGIPTPEVPPSFREDVGNLAPQQGPLRTRAQLEAEAAGTPAPMPENVLLPARGRAAPEAPPSFREDTGDLAPQQGPLRTRRQLEAEAAGTPAPMPENVLLPARNAGRTPLPEAPANAPVEASTPEPTPAPKREPISSILGNKTKMLLGDGSSVEARYGVVEGDDVLTSHNPHTFEPQKDYPEGVQGRDYKNNKGAQATVRSQAMDLNPEQFFNPTWNASDGPPGILPNGISAIGNQRGMMVDIAKAKAPDKYKAYQTELKARAAEFGIDPKAIDKLRDPRFVRILTDPKDTEGGVDRLAEINRKSDEFTGKAKSATEEADARAQRLEGAPEAMAHFTNTIDPEETISAYLEGKEGRTFVKALVDHSVITKQELGKLTGKGGELNDDGRTAVRRMMLAAAVGDAEALNTAPAGALEKLEHAVPAIVAIKGSSFDVSPAIQDALEQLARARTMGMTPHQLFAQMEMDGGEVPTYVQTMAHFLTDHKKSAVSAAFRRYGALAQEAIAGEGANDMFGGTGYTPARAYREAFGGEESVGQLGEPTPNRAAARRKFEGRPFVETLYSRAERAIEKAPFEKGTGEQWAALLKTDVPNDEREAITPHLTPAQSFTRAEVERILEKNKIVLGKSNGGLLEHEDDIVLAEANVRSAEYYLREQLGDLNTPPEVTEKVIASAKLPERWGFSPSKILRKNGVDLTSEGAAESAKHLTERVRKLIRATSALDELHTRGPKEQEPRYSQYTEPGGEKYAEHVLTIEKQGKFSKMNVEALRAKDVALQAEVTKAQVAHNVAINKGDAEKGDREHPLAVKVRELARKQMDANIAYIYAQGRRLDGRYTSSHWPGMENPLVHTRTTDRWYQPPGGGDPEHVLTAEEIQSDMHQEGRRRGYDNGRPPEQPDEENSSGKKKVPDFPFKKTAEWSELALKQLIHTAVEGHYDRVAWVDGARQAERYDLSKQVDHLSYHPEQEYLKARKDGGLIHEGTYAKEALPSVIGKEMADRLLATHPGQDQEVRNKLEENARTLQKVVSDIDKLHGSKDETESAEMQGIQNRARKVLREHSNLFMGTGERALEHITKYPAYIMGDTGSVLSDAEKKAILDYTGPWAEAAERDLGRKAKRITLGQRQRQLERDAEQLKESDDSHILRGVDLAMGGEGMRKYYDDMLPKLVKDYAKKLGVALPVEKINLFANDRPNISVETVDNTIQSYIDRNHGAPLSDRQKAVFRVMTQVANEMPDSGESPTETFDRLDGRREFDDEERENTELARNELAALEEREAAASERRGNKAEAPTTSSFKVTPELRAKIQDEGQRLMEPSRRRGRYDATRAPASRTFDGGDVVPGGPQGMTAALERANAVLADPHQRAYANANKPTLAYREAQALVNREGGIDSAELRTRQPDLAGDASETLHTSGQQDLFGGTPSSLESERPKPLTPARQNDLFGDHLLEPKRNLAQGDLFQPRQDDLFTPTAQSVALDFGGAAQRDLAQRLLFNEVSRMDRTEKGSLPTGEWRKLQLERSKTRQLVSPVGMRVDPNNPETIHTAISSIRNPYFEHLAVAGLKDGAIARPLHIYTSGLVDQVNTGDIEQFVKQVAADMKAEGIQDVGLAHNHPSGFGLASAADRQFTRAVSELLKKEGITVAWHYVTNHDHGTLLTLHDTRQEYDQRPGNHREAAERDYNQGRSLIKQDGSQPDRFIHAKGVVVSEAPIANDDWTNFHAGAHGQEVQLEQIARQLNPVHSATLAYLDTQGRIVAVAPHDMAAFTNLKTVDHWEAFDHWIEQQVKDHAAKSVVLLLPDDGSKGANDVISDIAARAFDKDSALAGLVTDIAHVQQVPGKSPTISSYANTHRYERDYAAQRRRDVSARHDLLQYPTTSPEYLAAKAHIDARAALPNRLQEPTPRRPDGEKPLGRGMIERSQTTLRTASDFFGAAAHDALAQARRLDPAYAELGDRVIASNSFAGHFARSMARWTDEPLSADESITLTRAQIVQRLEELNKREAAGQLSFLPSDVGDVAQRTATIARYRAMIPKGFLDRANVKVAVTRRRQIYRQVLEPAAIKGNVPVESFSQTELGHVKLQPVKEKGGAFESAAAPSAARTRTAQAANAAKGTALDYVTDWETLLASDGRDKFGAATMNDLLRATAKRGRVLTRGELMRPDEMRVTFADPENVIPEFGKQRTVAMPKVLGQAFGHITSVVARKAPASGPGSLLRTLDRLAGQAVFTMNPAALVSHSRNMANALGSAPEAGPMGWLKALGGMVPGVKQATGLVEILNQDMRTPRALAVRMRLASVGALRPVELAYGGLGERFALAKKNVLRRLGEGLTKDQQYQVEKLSVFGENGIDERARYGLALKFLKQRPNATDAELGQYVNRLAANYTRGAGGVAIQWLQDSKLSMFARIETAKISLGARTLIGRSGLPGKSPAQAAELWAKQMMLGPIGNKLGIAAAIAALSLLMAKQLTQAPDKENDIPLGGVDKQGRDTYASGRFLNPSDNVTKDLGLDALRRGDVRGAIQELTNTTLRVGASHPFARLGFGALLGAQANVDRQGKLRPLGAPTLSGKPRLATIAKTLTGMTSLSPITRGGSPNPGVDAALGEAMAYGGINATSASASADSVYAMQARQDVRAWLDGQTQEIYRAKTPDARQKVLRGAYEEMVENGRKNPQLGAALLKARAGTVLQHATERANARP